MRNLKRIGQPMTRITLEGCRCVHWIFHSFLQEAWNGECPGDWKALGRHYMPYFLVCWIWCAIPPTRRFKRIGQRMPVTYLSPCLLFHEQLDRLMQAAQEEAWEEEVTTEASQDLCRWSSMNNFLYSILHAVQEHCRVAAEGSLA